MSEKGKAKRLQNIEPHKWKKGQSGNPKGRPRKYVSTLTDQGYKKQEVRDTFAAIASMTMQELKELEGNAEATILELTTAKAFIKARKAGRYDLIKSMIELFADKPKQHTETEVKATVNIPVINWVD